MSIFYIHKATLNPTQNLYTMSMYILRRLLRPRAQLGASSAHSVVRGAPDRGRSGNPGGNPDNYLYL